MQLAGTIHNSGSVPGNVPESRMHSTYHIVHYRGFLRKTMPLSLRLKTRPVAGAFGVAEVFAIGFAPAQLSEKSVRKQVSLGYRAAQDRTP